MNAYTAWTKEKFNDFCNYAPWFSLLAHISIRSALLSLKLPWMQQINTP